jgi:hypothetical protein
VALKKIFDAFRNQTDAQVWWSRKKDEIDMRIDFILENLSWNCFFTGIWWTSKCYTITQCFKSW